jgi:hypothetical protein
VACPQGLSATGKLAACSGHGRCSSLRTAAATSNFLQLFNGSSYSDWDADMIHGCICDSGWNGVNCSLRSCPFGNDPSTTGNDELQVIDCTCDDNHCLGSFQLIVRGQMAPSLPINATEEMLLLTLQVAPLSVLSLLSSDLWCNDLSNSPMLKALSLISLVKDFVLDLVRQRW